VSLRGFQQALGALVASPDLCLRLRSGEDVLDVYESSERERGRLQSMVQQRGMSVNCTRYRANRVMPLYSLLPYSCTLLGERLADEVSLFWSSEPTDMQFGPEVERFAGFLTTRLDSGELYVPHMREVLEFEVALAGLRFLPRRSLLSSLDGRVPGGSWEVNPLLRIVRFANDPGVLLSALVQGNAPPTDIAAGDFYIVLDATAAEIAIRPLSPGLGARLMSVAAGGAAVDDDSPETRALIDARMLVPAS
jgi:hypothetical protein